MMFDWTLWGPIAWGTVSTIAGGYMAMLWWEERHDAQYWHTTSDHFEIEAEKVPVLTDVNSALKSEVAQLMDEGAEVKTALKSAMTQFEVELADLRKYKEIVLSDPMFRQRQLVRSGQAPRSHGKFTSAAKIREEQEAALKAAEGAIAQPGTESTIYVDETAHAPVRSGGAS